MSRTIVLKGGTIVTDKTKYVADVKIEGETIAEIGSFGDIVGAEVIDASGSFLFPGLIDVHTHLEMGEDPTRTADDFVSGTQAALAGGTTCLIDFATQDKGGTLAQALQAWTAKVENRALCDVGFHMAIVDWNDGIKAEMQDMMDAGVTSFKMYMAYNQTLRSGDGQIYEALEQAREIGGLVGFHCENGDIIEARTKELLAQGKTTPYYHPVSRPPLVESESIYRLTQMAKLTGAPIWVVHLSTKQGLEIIREQRQQGVDIVTETCPQYLVLDESVYGTPEDTSFEGGKYVIAPPIRSKEHQEAMWSGLQDRDIDLISTDHCSFQFDGQKTLGKDDFSKIPNGGPGLEHRLGLMYTYGVKSGRITLTDLVRLNSTRPATLFGLENKGAIEVGKDADIVLFDPRTSQIISAAHQYQNVDYTPYEGMVTHGQVSRVLLRGQTVYQDGKFIGQAAGKFVARAPYSKW